MSPLPAVCFFQAYNRDYIRTETLLAGLKANGVPVVTCQVNRPDALRYPLAFWKFLKAMHSCDVVLANFRSFEMLWLLRLLTRKPILYDAHISFWQSACEERQWFGERSPLGRLLFFLDRFNCRIADRVLIDTEAHRDYFVRTFVVPREKITVVYISCEDHLFFPRPATAPSTGRPVTVFWSGSGIPLQGLDVIYEAFKRLQDRGVDVVLRLAGASGILDRVRKRAEADGVRNLVFLGQLPRSQVVEEVAAADIGLGGHYSSVPKAAQVIAGKAYELIAMRKAAILGDSLATRELFVDGESALLCKMGSPEALADAVERLAGDAGLRERLADGGYNLYRERLRPEVDVAPLLPVLAEMGRRKGGPGLF